MTAAELRKLIDTLPDHATFHPEPGGLRVECNGKRGWIDFLEPARTHIDMDVTVRPAPAIIKL